MARERGPCGGYDSRVTLRLLLPPSVGSARAHARAELLEQSLKADLAEEVVIDVANGYADLAERVEAGEADMVWMPPTICARLEPRLRSIHKCVRHGHTTYRSCIVVRTGEVSSLSGLEGLRAAWVDRLSVGGYLLAHDDLERQGLTAAVLGEQSFEGTYPDALDAVLEGRADFGALTVRDDTPAATRDGLATHGGKAAADGLTGIHVTRTSPNDAIGISQALDARRAERIARRVFDKQGARARAALCLALDAEGFVRATPGEYAALRSLLEHDRRS